MAGKSNGVKGFPDHARHAKPGRSERARLLIFVIAYHAEETLKSVLERIPRDIFGELDCEILVVDDASTDRTFEIGCEYRDAHPEIPFTVLRNEFNQGYGGNQKVGYGYALAHGFDFVAMVHGDGQYAPEKLPELVEPLVRGEADAVFGSRMMTRFGALKGGMPLYKYVGNKILTTMQNSLLGSKLSEFHSGYRIYSVKALASVPFQLNSNDFHFDTEIIIQFLNAGLRIQEIAIPTYYGDEISRVNGMKYAKDVTVATVRNVLHRSGLMYQRRFDTVREDNTHYDLKLGYPSSHSYAIEAVKSGARVLDIGSGPLGVASELVAKGCQVTVVDQHEPEREPPRAMRVLVQDLNEPPAFDVDVDTVLMLDVIEHLRSPEKFMQEFRAKLDFRPRTVVMTTGNVAFVAQRLMLLLGQFNYGKKGILDRTHTRLFTFRSFEQLATDAGMRIKEVKGVPAPFPLVLGNGVLGKLAVGVNMALIRVSKTLFSYQIYVRAETTPDLAFVLGAARTHAEKLSSSLAPPASSGDTPGERSE